MHFLMNNLGDLAGLDIAARRAAGSGLAAEPLPAVARRSHPALSAMDTILRHAAQLFGRRPRDSSPFEPKAAEAARVPKDEGETRSEAYSP